MGSQSPEKMMFTRTNDTTQAPIQVLLILHEGNCLEMSDSESDRKYLSAVSQASRSPQITSVINREQEMQGEQCAHHS